jgi:predicted nucleic acid-binding protein
MSGSLPHRRGLLDTSVFIAIEQDRPLDIGALPLEQYVSAITRGELLAGVHAAASAEVRAVRLATVEEIAGISTLPADSRAAAHWAALRHSLAAAGRRVNVNDLWIAAIALAHGLPVVTQDGDFAVISEHSSLQVIAV